MYTHTCIQVSNGRTIDLPSALVLYSELCVLLKAGEHQKEGKKREVAFFAVVGATASKLFYCTWSTAGVMKTEMIMCNVDICFSKIYTFKTAVCLSF